MDLQRDDQPFDLALQDKTLADKRQNSHDEGRFSLSENQFTGKRNFDKLFNFLVEESYVFFTVKTFSKVADVEFLI